MTPIPDIVHYRLDNGEECLAVVTKRHSDGMADLRIILSPDQVSRYANRDGWWEYSYLFAMHCMPPECYCSQGAEPGQFYVTGG